jgi:fructose-bisphosphate aldolase, class I
MSEHDLESIARAIVEPGKGILAADESFPTIKKRFTGINLESTEDARRAYRQMLFTTPGVEQFISGVITFDETLRHSTPEGKPFPQLLSEKGIIPGIKVDKGAVDLAFHPGEKITEGLDGLRARCQEYFKLGARFTKWRAVITIGDGIPSDYCLQANAEALARYAALSQESGLVPIVEPEVLMDGDHDLARCEEVTGATLEALYEWMYRAGVSLEGSLLKPNMVISGKNCAVQATTREIAEATIRVLKRAVPPAVPGIVFLSGGQTPAQSCENLSMMNAIGSFPWQLSYSYGRALQDEALKAWGGQAANLQAGQKAFYRRSQMASQARYGAYKPEMEAVPA